MGYIRVPLTPPPKKMVQGTMRCGMYDVRSRTNEIKPRVESFELSLSSWCYHRLPTTGGETTCFAQRSSKGNPSGQCCADAVGSTSEQPS